MVLRSPDDTWRLYPLASGRTSPMHFQVDLMRPNATRFPLLDNLQVYSVETEPGDVLFVPETWPHQTENIDDSIAYSMNYVDEHNLHLYEEAKWTNLGQALEEGRLFSAIEAEFYRLPDIRRLFFDRALKARTRKTHWRADKYRKYWRISKMVGIKLFGILRDNIPSALLGLLHAGRAFLSENVAFHKALGLWMTPLDLALFLGNQAAANLLIQYNASVDGMRERTITSGRKELSVPTSAAPPLFWALLSGEESLVVSLLRAGADASSYLFKGMRASHVASVIGLERLLQAILAVRVECVDARGLSPILYANAAGCVNLASLLNVSGCSNTNLDVSVDKDKTTKKEALQSVQDLLDIVAECWRGRSQGQCQTADATCKVPYFCSRDHLSSISFN